MIFKRTWPGPGRDRQYGKMRCNLVVRGGRLRREIVNHAEITNAIQMLQKMAGSADEGSICFQLRGSSSDAMDGADADLPKPDPIHCEREEFNAVPEYGHKTRVRR